MEDPTTDHTSAVRQIRQERKRKRTREKEESGRKTNRVQTETRGGVWAGCSHCRSGHPYAPCHNLLCSHGRSARPPRVTNRLKDMSAPHQRTHPPTRGPRLLTCGSLGLRPTRAAAPTAIPPRRRTRSRTASPRTTLRRPERRPCLAPLATTRTAADSRQGAAPPPAAP